MKMLRQTICNKIVSYNFAVNYVVIQIMKIFIHRNDGNIT